MSTQASTNFITSFDAMVKAAYQAAGTLRDAVRVKTGVKGSSHKFFIIGQGVATERIPQTDITPMNITHGNVTATLKDYSAGEYSDVLDLEKLSYDEKQELARAVANAMGRRCDQIIIDALIAGANSTTVAATVQEGTGTSACGFNIKKLLEAQRLMNDANVPDDGNRYMAISALALQEALLDPKISSGDYSTIMAIQTGKLKEYAGFKFKIIGTRKEGGLPKESSARTNLAWHKDAIGLAIGHDMHTEINYIPEKTSWLTNGLFSAGAVVIDKDGVYKVMTKDA